jgi:YD repeat-containing protein
MADTVAKILLRAEGGAQVAGTLSGIGGSLKRLESVGAQVNRALGGMFAPLLAGASVAGIVKGFSGIVNALDDMAKASQRVGVTVETLSALKYAADLSGVSFDQLQTGLAQFSKRLVDVGDGASQAGALLRQFGVTAGDDTRTALGKVAAAFARAEDGAAKTAAAMELFGRSGTELIPLLNSGADGLDTLTREAERLGLVMETETAKAAEQFNDNLTRLKGAATGLAMDLSGPLVSALADLTNAMVVATQEGSGLYGVLRAIAVEQFGLLTNKALSNLSYDIARTQDSIAKLEGGGGLLGWMTTSGERAAALEQERAALAGLRQEQQGLIEKEVELRAARDKAVEGGKLIIQIEGGVERARGGGAKAARAAAGAEDKLRSEIERTIKGLETQTQKLTLGERGFLAYELAAKRATPEQIQFALSLYDQVEALEAAAKGAQDTGREVDILATVTERAAEGMTDALSEAFANIFRDGVKSFKDLADTLKNLFYKLLGDLLAASLANPIRIALGVGGTAAAGAASAATGGAGGALSFLNPSSLIGGLVNGMPAGILGTAGNMLSFGSAGLMSGTASGMLAGATMLAPLALPLLGALALPKLLGDKTEPRAQWVAQTGGAGFEDSVFARSNLLGLSFGLGGKSHEVDAASYGPQLQAMAQMADLIGAAVGPEVAKAIAARVAGTTDQMKGSGLALDGWSAEQAALAIFGDILGFAADTGDALARVLAERVGPLSGSLEEMSAQLARVTAEVSGAQGLAEALARLGYTLGATEEASLRAALELADLAGGAQAMLAAADALNTLLVPESERAAQSLAQMAQALAAVGVTLPDTRAELRTLVAGLDLTSESGRLAYATLAQLAAGVEQHYGQIEQAAAQALAAEAALAEQRRAATDRLEQLLLGEEAYAAVQAERAQAEVDRIALERLGIATGIGSLEVLRATVERLGGVSEAVRALGADAQAFVEAASGAFSTAAESVTAVGTATTTLGGASAEYLAAITNVDLARWLQTSGLRDAFESIWRTAREALATLDQAADQAMGGLARLSDELSALFSGRIDQYTAAQIPGTLQAVLAAAEREAPTREAYELIARRVAGQAERLATTGATDRTFAEYYRDDQGRLRARTINDRSQTTDLQIAQMRSLYERMLRIFDRWDYDGLPATRT